MEHTLLEPTNAWDSIWYAITSMDYTSNMDIKTSQQLLQVEAQA